ncbi:TrmH family RNA methyltransferase [Catelliglobosispora koreensis]|uniref:TrmH family RNA methyltransferase n=1 Tax=Catelliglobosispora koreensis TaxID=129052 RepID=UPI00036A4A46|nr:RNA methyltransferase [Catelliglobosispora koreensis]
MRNATKPGEGPFTTRTPRVSAAIKLHRRKDRDATGLFLAEGPQAVNEALAAGVVKELFSTRSDYPNATLVTEEALQALADTVSPQGVVAVCEQASVPLGQLKAGKLIAVAVDIRDPGNAGTILRTADAAGASAVIFAGEAVDPYNGKCVRASAGSLFHVDIVRERSAATVMTALAKHGMQILATSGRGATDLFELEPHLAKPTAWLFGSEAHGLPAEVLEKAQAVRVPIYGGAESLNLAAAAAVCLYASARAQRSSYEL